MEMDFSIGQSIEFGFSIGGGGVSPSPEPGSSGDVITGVPVVRMSGVVVPISGVIAGTAEEVE